MSEAARTAESGREPIGDGVQPPPSQRPPVVFIGPMGAGKSRLGKRVARLLEVEHADTDKMVEAKHGPISEIFERLGEQGFRALERHAVREVMWRPVVVSLGGGAVLDQTAKEELEDVPVVYLSISPEAVEERLAADTKRPLLKDGGIEAWKRILEKRRALYQEYADLEIDTSRRNLDEVAEEVVAWLKSR